MRTVEEIRETLHKDGINFTLIMRMTEEELRKADSYEDYEDYGNYMNYLARKYNI